MLLRRCVGCSIVAALVATGAARAADPADGVGLTVAYDKPSASVTLSWVGSQPDFEVFRSSAAGTVTAPANSLGVTSARSQVDIGPGSLAFYRVTSAPGTVASGAPDRMLLSGTIVGPTGFFEGQVLVEGNVMTCVAPVCAGMPGAAGATVVATNGIVMPGLVDAGDHVLYDIFDATDWSPSQVYTNHNQWTAETRYQQMVDCKLHLNGENGSLVDVGCEMDKYGEIKALIAGTTSKVGQPGTGRACYASVIRTLDLAQNDLGADKIQTSLTIPTESSASTVCTNFGSGATDAYVVAVADGTDTNARNEYQTLAARAGGCLLSPKTTIAYGTALGTPEFSDMAAHGMKLVWSPRSNVTLYNDTARVDLAKAAGVPAIALSPDWSPTGSANLLDELRFADAVDAQRLGDLLTPEDLFRMVTLDAARTVGLGGVLGSLEVGKRADVAVIAGDRADPYRALLAARPATVRLVLVDGRALYGDANLMAAGAPGNTCEAASICATDKFLCVAEASTSSKLDQTFATIRQVLVDALQSYDASVAPLVAPFSPLAPLATCP